MGLLPWHNTRRSRRALGTLNRGPDRRFIFGDAEKEMFVQMMRKYEWFCSVPVMTFCVMSNHFHILVEVPSGWYNKKAARQGTLWERRFRSVLVQSGDALMKVAAYIELNPIWTEPKKRRPEAQACGCRGTPNDARFADRPGLLAKMKPRAS